MNGLDPRQHLLRNHNNGFDGESSVAVIKKVFQTRTKKVNHKYVVKAFLSEIVNIGYTRASDENLVGSIFISELGCIALSRFKFDGDLLVVQQIRSFKDNTKRTLSNLLPDAVVHPDNIGR